MRNFLHPSYEQHRKWGADMKDATKTEIYKSATIFDGAKMRQIS
jgi:hypothetical protein